MKWKQTGIYNPGVISVIRAYYNFIEILNQYINLQKAGQEKINRRDYLLYKIVILNFIYHG